MESREVRKSFLEYFRSRGHEIVKSSSLVPQDDPTLLFTNAGMVQFKSVFLGHEQRPYKRATSCQKCMRAGGKHSDLENVGHTARHHTFFEMLGNFSFGDYFKKEAIQFAWELLTEWYRLPKDRLWVSVYEEDAQAESLWKELTDVDPARIVRLGAKDNFWQMGDTGPCGPCSEIIIDQGQEVGCGRDDCNLECDCDRYLELWNLVFMQYNRDESGKLTPLPKPSIDTGMGLERITAVLQGKHNNFDTDLFQPIIEEISTLSGIPYGKAPHSDASMRVIADHIRAITFLLSEGLIPSNEGRGYVLRRVIRRAARHARLLNLPAPTLHRFIEPVISVMGDIYPEIIDERDRTEKLLKIEEERFVRTIETGMNILDEILTRLKEEGSDVIPGEELFRLYDTYGFPIDLARDIANDEGYRIDEEGFHRRLQEQKQKARTGAGIQQQEESTTLYREIVARHGETLFKGYETLKEEAEVVEIISNGRFTDELGEGQEGMIVLDRTPFYGESGGQVGDTGVIHSEGAHLIVTDTKKPLQGLHIHIVKVKRGTVRRGERVTAMVDEERRLSIMRNHTATHLLHKALRMVLGEHVKQSGSLVAPDRLRFDFTHYTATTPEEIDEIEEVVNTKILEDLPVKTEVMGIDDAIRSGAVALFDEKYGEKVRVVSAGSFSRELCGGTHCSATGQIGSFVILSESSVASGIRRIEALTGMNAFRYLKEQKRSIEMIKNILKTDRPVERTERLIRELKEKEKEIERLKTGASTDVISEAIRKARELSGIKIATLRKDGLNQKELRLLSDRLRDRLGSGIIITTSAQNGKAAIVCMVTKDLTDRFNAGEILKRITSLAGGSGGGRAEMAQGGVKDIEALEEAMKRIEELIKEGS
ncbi:MAG TPA: alanine--tRNA ligase [Nitrospirae bacterium]|nr:alanine--tRNA ligase [Nitrospirota bacterium]